MEYGYINESGFLRAKTVEERKVMFIGTDGKPQYRTVTVEEQAEVLAKNGWKPVDELDNDKLKADDGYIVRVKPYDAGGRISYEYETVKDAGKVKREISALKEELDSSDYKVIKCYEASLTGETMPYDAATLHSERQAIRDRINELQGEL